MKEASRPRNGCRKRTNTGEGQGRRIGSDAPALSHPFYATGRFFRPAVMHSRPVKWKGAVPVFVDVHGVISGTAGDGEVGKTEKFRFHENPPVGGGIEFYQAGQSGIGVVPRHPGRSAGRVLQHCPKESETGSIFSHKNLHSGALRPFLLGYAACRRS